MSKQNPRNLSHGSAAARRILGNHGGYRNQKAYQVAELLYDLTCRFCDRYIPFKDRHHDQMVQSARSGYQNLAEGSVDGATSAKLEINLTNVARGSLDELRKDYVKFLTGWNSGLHHWQQDDPRFMEARNLRPQTLEEAAAWANLPDAPEPARERATNLGAILAAQAEWLAGRLLDHQAQEFEKNGGFSERMYKARSNHRKNTGAEGDG